jgi:surface antigen
MPLAGAGLVMAAPLEAAVLQCVQYAREITQVPLQGDAWTWWGKAPRAGLRRGRPPEAGAILVFRRTERLARGHVAVVAEVVGRREIVVDHANWASRRDRAARGHVDMSVRVVDVSPANDWSAVRVWHAPSDSLGQRVYPTYGFIYPAAEVQLAAY